MNRMTLLSLLVLSGCVISINPVVTERDTIFDERLPGSWEESDGSGRAVISYLDDGMYAIAYENKDDTSSLRARLGHLGGYTLLDVWPDPGKKELSQTYSDLMVAGHLLFTLTIGKDEIRTQALDPDSLLAALDAGVIRIDHTISGDRVVLGGGTGDLRAALGPYLSRAGVLGEPSVWRRSPGTSSRKPVPVPCFEASAWHEADQLFHRDPHWVGGDCASSVELGDGRILWLFGDSWIDSSGQGTRRGARMVSNSVAVQEGTNPAESTIRFYWGRAADGSPGAFIPDEDDQRHWFGNGVRVGDRLVLFLNSIRKVNRGLGFESVGWMAWMVENPDSDPSMWHMRQLETPANPLGVLVGFAAVMLRDEYLYAFGSEDPVKSHPIYVARWTVDQIRNGNLLHPEWWAGDDFGWIPESSHTARRPIFENGQSELTIHADRETGQFISVQTKGFGPADIYLRAAPALTGPWSMPRMLHRPSEYYRPNVMIYAAKAHPELTGGDLVVTYATNSFRFADQTTDSLMYYPKFLRLTRCREVKTDE